jgi:hypothetical protein
MAEPQAPFPANILENNANPSGTLESQPVLDMILSQEDNPARANEICLEPNGIAKLRCRNKRDSGDRRSLEAPLVRSARFSKSAQSVVDAHTCFHKIYHKATNDTNLIS